MYYLRNFLPESFVRFVDFLQIILVFNVDRNIVAQGAFKLIKIRGNIKIFYF